MAATVPNPDPLSFPPPPYCSSSSISFSSTLPTVVNPRSTSPPPQNPILAPDLPPAKGPAPILGAVHAPVIPPPSTASVLLSIGPNPIELPPRSAAVLTSVPSPGLSVPIIASAGALPPPQQSYGPVLGPTHQAMGSSSQPLSGNPSSSHMLPSPPPSLRSASTSKPSYAQAVASVRGTGFVRSHAVAVDHFARIPRTGAKIICGSREGIPSFSFVPSDLPKVEEIYSNALVMKFSGGRPSLESSHKEILSWGMEKSFSIGPLTSRSFLLRFQDDKDLLKVLTRPSSILITFPYKIFRWHNQCHLSEDSSMAPVWISLPRLPMQCFIPEFLESVGNKLGKFLCFDKATSTLARPSAARICVEVDLRNQAPPFIWVGLFEGFKQQIIYERLPKYCMSCHKLGHASDVCSKFCNEEQHHASVGQSTLPKGCTPPVRQNAVSTAAYPNLQNSPPLVPPPPPAPPSLPEGCDLPEQSTSLPGARADRGQRPALLSLPTSPKPSAPSPTTHQSQQPTSLTQHPADITLVQQSQPVAPKPIPSIKPNPRKKKSKDKSVSFNLSDQSNLSANIAFWNAVNSQVSNLEHNPSNTSPHCGSTNPPVTPHGQVPSQPSTKAPQPTHGPSPPPNSLAPQLDVHREPSLTRRQQDALERFKHKVRAQSQDQGQQLISSSSTNQFESLLQDQSEEEDDDHVAASYDSDGNISLEEHIDMGYQSADGQSVHRHGKSMAPGMKANKRHPNIPLNVRLRTRKHPYPSAHISLGI